MMQKKIGLNTVLARSQISLKTHYNLYHTLKNPLQGVHLSQLNTAWQILHHTLNPKSYTVVIRYNTIGGVHKYKSCYKPIVLHEMARFYLVLLDTI